jgi:hypothetical protein
MRNRARRRSCLSATDSDLHVYNRGVDQGTIFFTEGDYLDFLELRVYPGADGEFTFYED